MRIIPQTFAHNFGSVGATIYCTHEGKLYRAIAANEVNTQQVSIVIDDAGVARCLGHSPPQRIEAYTRVDRFRHARPQEEIPAENYWFVYKIEYFDSSGDLTRTELWVGGDNNLKVAEYTAYTGEPEPIDFERQEINFTVGGVAFVDGINYAIEGASDSVAEFTLIEAKQEHYYTLSGTFTCDGSATSDRAIIQARLDFIDAYTFQFDDNWVQSGEFSYANTFSYQPFVTDYINVGINKADPGDTSTAPERYAYYFPAFTTTFTPGGENVGDIVPVFVENLPANRNPALAYDDYVLAEYLAGDNDDIIFEADSFSASFSVSSGTSNLFSKTFTAYDINSLGFNISASPSGTTPGASISGTITLSKRLKTNPQLLYLAKNGQALYLAIRYLIAEDIFLVDYITVQGGATTQTFISQETVTASDWRSSLIDFTPDTEPPPTGDSCVDYYRGDRQANFQGSLLRKVDLSSVTFPFNPRTQSEEGLGRLNDAGVGMIRLLNEPLSFPVLQGEATSGETCSVALSGGISKPALKLTTPIPLEGETPAITILWAAP